ncbi:MAG: methyl-accepting chemotaxis protein [Pseudomonadota bacterium]
MRNLITQWLSASKNLSESTAVLTALDKVQAIISFELDGTIVDANQNFLDALGYAREEIVGKHHRMFVEPGEAAQPAYVEFWKKLGHGEYHKGEYKRITKDGREVWIEASYNPVLDADGRPIRIVKFAIDVTEAKLKSANAVGQLEAISRSQAVIEFTVDGVIQHANQNFLDATGYSLGEVKGRHHRMFVEPEYADSAEYAAFWRDLKNGEFSSAEYKRFGKGGREIWIQASYNPILDADGRPFKVVKYATDITGRKQAVAEIGDNLMRFADGDLEASISADIDAEFYPLRDAFNGAVERLRRLVRDIKSATVVLGEASEAITTGAKSLSSRSEGQASSLQETAATMEEMSASIRANAENAGRADTAANEASSRAKRGGEVVNEAIEAMGRIEGSSAKIADIISVIESIAFQTNLLALNAAVEAARAGDAGKGFAVVASEVRTLAQRSSEAAKDITQLIQSSTSQVSEGAELVRRTGGSLDEIGQSIKSVVTNVSEIASASRQQASGVEEISGAISNLDSVTQENAALSEASVSDADRLMRQAQRLQSLVSVFRLTKAEAVADRAWTETAESVAGAPAAVQPQPARAAGGAWSEF